MNLISREDMQQLATRGETERVSIYMPTQRAGREILQGSIRLKNMLGQAEAQLRQQNLRGDDIRDLLGPARQLIDDVRFWQHQSDGLALFLTKDWFRHYRLPLRLEELVVVNDQFHIKPLLPLITVDGRFYVLALSQNQVRILQGTRQSVSELDVAGVPESLADALKYDDPEKSLQFRQGGAETGATRAAHYHGHGAGDNEQKTRLLRYFQQIDRGLRDLLAADNAPLILAGVDYYFPIYREANSYNYLVDEGLEGNPEHLDTRELHGRAWQVVEPIFKRKLERARELYQEALSKDQASADLKPVVRAARDGRVDTLFVARGRHQWGVFDREQNSITLHDQQQAGDEDLLDYAALQTFSTGGTVYVLEQNQMPNGDSIGAIYRY